jgi:hypothetical protein
MPNGVVMAAFGQKYVDLAYQAAGTLRQHNPKLEVDLFTDMARNLGPFSRVHILHDVWIRSKIDAMLQSRFDKTLYLDVDLLVLADLSDIFEVLDRFDVAAAHDQYRNSTLARKIYREPIANSFPQINSGVFAFCRTAPVLQFLQEWKCEIKTHGIGKDQHSLRELLWKREIKLAVLPPEYNLWDLATVDYMTPRFHAAPRILHSYIFQVLPEPPPGKNVLIHYLGKARAHKIGLLLAADEALAARAGRAAKLPTRRERRKMQWLYTLAGAVRIGKALGKALKTRFQRIRALLERKT